MNIPPSASPVNLTASGADSSSPESSFIKKRWEEKARPLIQLLLKITLFTQYL